MAGDVTTARDGHPLLLAAGELVRAVSRAVLGAARIAEQKGWLDPAGWLET